MHRHQTGAREANIHFEIVVGVIGGQIVGEFGGACGAAYFAVHAVEHHFFPRLVQVRGQRSHA